MATLRIPRPRFLLAALVLGLFLSTQLGLLARADTYVTGMSNWQGTYVDSRSGVAVHKVPFKLSVNVSPDGSFTGRISEPATFGTGGSTELYANVTGGVNASEVWWKKTYDGTNGVSHSVFYHGTLGAGGKTMSGTWSLSGASGTFAATLTSGHPLVFRTTSK